MNAISQDTIDIISESLSDALIDGDWKADPRRFADGLAKRGRYIVDAVAHDHATVATAMTRRLARWESWGADGRGELCFGGIRYSTTLDTFGIPKLCEHTRSRLLSEIAKVQS